MPCWPAPGSFAAVVRGRPEYFPTDPSSPGQNHVTIAESGSSAGCVGELSCVPGLGFCAVADHRNLRCSRTACVAAVTLVGAVLGIEDPVIEGVVLDSSGTRLAVSVCPVARRVAWSAREVLAGLPALGAVGAGLCGVLRRLRWAPRVGTRHRWRRSRGCFEASRRAPLRFADAVRRTVPDRPPKVCTCTAALRRDVRTQRQARAGSLPIGCPSEGFTARTEGISRAARPRLPHRPPVCARPPLRGGVWWQECDLVR